MTGKTRASRYPEDGISIASTLKPRREISRACWPVPAPISRIRAPGRKQGTICSISAARIIASESSLSKVISDKVSRRSVTAGAISGRAFPIDRTAGAWKCNSVNAAGEVGSYNRLSPALAPRFQHQHIPNEILPIARAVEVLLPVTPHHRGIEQPRFAQALFVEQRLGPVAQRSAQPFAERNAEAHLRPLDQGGRDVTIEELAG